MKDTLCKDFLKLVREENVLRWDKALKDMIADEKVQEEEEEEEEEGGGIMRWMNGGGVK